MRKGAGAPHALLPIGPMDKIIIDLDGTLTIDDGSVGYADRLPQTDVIDRLREYRERGFAICIYSSRNMRTYAGNVGQINIHTLPVIVDWLKRHDVPYDEVLVGKPWCGFNGFYVDDRALRPDEFARLSPDEAIHMFGVPTN